MGTIYGESIDIPVKDNYDQNGGIALFSIGDGEGGTITGGSGDSEEGGYETFARILWSITVNENGSYMSGGITGSGDWMRDKSNSPFLTWEDQVLANEAIQSGNLNTVFSQWNNSTKLTDIFQFLSDAADKHPGCVSGFVG